MEGTEQKNRQSQEPPPMVEPSPGGAPQVAEDDHMDSSDRNESALDPSKKRKREKDSQQLGDTPWWMIRDPDAEKPYFYNSDTHKTVWTLPQELQEAHAEFISKNVRGGTENAEDGPSATKPKSTTKKQKTVASEAELPPDGGGRSEAAAKEKASKQIGDTEWWIIDDPHAEKPYFYNSETHKTVWSLPDEIQAKFDNLLTSTPAASTQPSSASAGVSLSSALVNMVNRKKEKQSAQVAEGARSRARPKDARTHNILNNTQNKRLGNSDWWMIQDTTNPSRVYYYNTKTDKTQWNAPTISTSEQPSTSSRAAPPQSNGSRGAKTSTQIGSSEWWMINDPAADRPYYFNTLTQKTRWNPPHIPPEDERKKTSKQIKDTEWWEIEDPNTSKVYYYNSSTQKTQWDYPLKSRGGVETVDISAGHTDRTSFNSHVPIANLKCQPICEAKVRSQNLLAQLRNVNKQKKMWQQKYGESEESRAMMDSLASPAIESSVVPPTDNLLKPIPENIQSVKKGIVEAIETCGRATMIEAISTSDLRQLLLLKTEFANAPSLQTIFKYLHQPPLSEVKPSKTTHPSHISAASGDNLNWFDLNRSFPCFQCGQRFILSEALTEHLRSHTSEEFECPQKDCHLSFSSSLFLDLHRNAHRDASPSPSLSPAVSEMSKGERLFKHLKRLDPAISASNYRNDDGQWDLEGLQEDVGLSEKEQASPPDPAVPEDEDDVVVAAADPERSEPPPSQANSVTTSEP